MPDPLTEPLPSRRVFYRATFIQPRPGPINPMGLKVRAPVEVEIWRGVDHVWRARSAHNRALLPGIEAQPTAEKVRQQVEALFEQQTSPWKACDAKGQPCNEVQQVSSSSTERQPPAKRKNTHALHPNQWNLGPGCTLALALCGRSSILLASLVAEGHQPTCQTCQQSLKA